MLENNLKEMVAFEAIQYIKNVDVIGIGTGSTVNCFVNALAETKQHIEGAIASSVTTEKSLKKRGIPLIDLNSVPSLEIYIDGADEFNEHCYLIKGGGGALTREKIIASIADNFVCMVSENKKVDVLGRFPLPIEVIPMARSFVAREVAKLQGSPVYRNGFVTDNGNIILDVYNLNFLNPIELERTLNNIPGIVGNGLFTHRPADILLVGTASGVQKIVRKK
ncbi:ribose-5-phosphate isomerase RpiA [Coxiella endosymbiont of Amblyomma sculptum]|uniref:ribose-5-phosphate isomerase RpiA n=1 Tax=Coxiella endosymbiont of Amblyomma sculptum TaxID=2487929 RepID=UPI00132EE66D|nr:ribose-5-phosphate isomerase RpiA [Coxiella endosymbiont of Amblyomma sculptum]QHG92216.1 ribose-5-phosphate isomerase RpiA [Coxiella endosymbiont of Amblyomma sculptum]